MAEVAECVAIGAMDFEKLADFAQEKEIDLTVIGMDDPLVGGVVDVFEERGLRIFGPRKNAAILEGSKAFSKDLMKKYNIPTAAYENFDDAEKALAYLETASFPIVLKADGLALGKGVIIAKDMQEAEKAILDSGESVAFRFATLFGASPRMRLDLLVNDFVYRAVFDRSLIVFEGHFMRNYLHVRDAANAFIFAMDNFEKMCTIIQ